MTGCDIDKVSSEKPHFQVIDNPSEQGNHLMVNRNASPISHAESRHIHRRKAGPGLPPIRVLVVDDFVPFRQFISSTLRTRHELQIIGEVSDGLEAVRKAEELKPDLILLDIGLPTLDGIEAARRIRRMAPECKIIFVSQESSAEVVEDGLRLGALGYVIKAKAARDLLPAIEAAVLGKQFVSAM